MNVSVTLSENFTIHLTVKERLPQIFTGKSHCYSTSKTWIVLVIKFYQLSFTSN